MAASFWDWSNLLGGDLSKLLGLGNPLNMPPPVPTGTSPTGVVTPPGPILGGAPPAAASTGGLLGGPPLGHKGLFGDFGDSVLGHGLAGALAGIGSVQPGTGMLGALGQGAQGAMDAGAAKQQQELKNWYMQQTMQQANQKTQTAQQQRDYLANAAPPPGVDPAQWKTYVQADPEGALAVLGKTMAPDKPTHSGAYNEYQDAVASGYKGSFTDYQNEDANRRRPVSTTTNVTNVPKAPPTLEERNRDILIHGDPSSPEYAAAWDDYMRPRLVTNPDGTATVVTPTPPTWAKKPTYSGAPAGGAAIPSDTSIEGSAIDPSKTDTSGNELAQPVPATAAGTTTTPPAATTTAPGFTTTTVGTPREKAPTQDEAKNRQLSQRVVQQLPNILKNYDELAKTPNILSAKIGGPMGTATMSTGAQLAYNGLLDLAASYLYSVSGATANPGEVQNLAQTIMPQVNDAPETLAAKKARIQEMADSIQPRTGQSATGDQGGGAKLYFDSQGNQIPGP